jgi:hypothetical protein
MKLACEGRDPVVGETADEPHAAMMAHGAEVHSNLLDGKSPDEVQQIRQMMDADVRQMIGNQN